MTKKPVKRKIAKLTDLQPDPQNANKGTEAGQSLVEWSLRTFGAGRSILVDKNGLVGAGNKTFQAAVDIGLTAKIVEATGNELVVVQRNDLDFTTPEGRAFAVADNRTAQVGLEWDAAVLAQIEQEAPDAMERMFKSGEVQRILDEAHLEDNLGVPKGSQPNTRHIPIDLIFTLYNLTDPAMVLARAAGWKVGVCSAGTTGKPNHWVHRPDRWVFKGGVCFVDNNYFHYNHAVHLDAVKTLKPKYATVRDIMDKGQCVQAGIDYYPLAQILDWAEELNEYAENVILIPKYDCIDRIPDKFVLGYSVPTSHGGTPLPLSEFKGRRVHLLGGSWKAQLAHMAALGDDVVSLDNNYIMLVAYRWGAFIDGNGNKMQLRDFGLSTVTNPLYISLAISLGLIGTRVNELYGGQGKPAEVGGEKPDEDEDKEISYIRSESAWEDELETVE